MKNVELRGRIKYKNAIYVDEKLLKELEEIILVYYKTINYRATLYNGDTIVFDSLTELLQYENVEERRIISLLIGFDIGNEIIFEEKSGYSLFSSYQYTVTGNYSMNNTDDSILFTNKIYAALNKNKRRIWYTIVTKISMMHFSLILLIVSFSLYLYLKFTTVATEAIYITADTWLLSCLYCLIFFSVSFIMAKIRKRVLPSISYMIGEEIKRIQKGEALISNIFWGIIVAFGVSVVCSLIL